MLKTKVVPALCICFAASAYAQQVSFAPATFTATDEIEPVSAAIGDFNSDGIPDLAVLTTLSNVSHIRINVGNGDGTFRSGAIFNGTPAKPALGSLQSGDVNGDGKADLVMFDGSTGFSVFLGRGDGTFQAAVNFLPLYSAPQTIVLGDFDGDGSTDVAMLTGTGLHYLEVWLGFSGGKFKVTGQTILGPNVINPYASLASADLNGGSRSDVISSGIIAGQFGVSLGDPSGRFPTSLQSNPINGLVEVTMATGDFNLDGKPDLVFGAFNTGNLYIGLGQGNGNITVGTTPFSFIPPQYGLPENSRLQLNSLVVADFNGDGRPDVGVVAGYLSDSGLILYNPSVAVGSAQSLLGSPTLLPIDAGGNKQLLLTADLNRDGRPDLIGLNDAGYYVVLNTTMSSTPNMLALSPTSLQFTYTTGAANPAPQTVNLTNSGAGTFFWSAAASAPWLTVTPAAGNPPARLSVSINPSLLPVGTTSGTIAVTVPGLSNSPQKIAVTATVSSTAPAISINSITSAASPLQTNAAPGEIITIKGQGLGPATGLLFSVDPITALVGSQLGGAQVLIGNIPAPLLYVSAAQINAIVPYEIANQTSAPVHVQYQNNKSQDFAVNVAAASPAAFTSDSSGSGQAAASNQDGSLNSASNPAAKGSYVTLYMTGGGQTNPPGVTGSVTGSVLKQFTLPVSVTVGGVPATVAFAGAAPFFVDGVGQLNIILGANTPSGPSQPVVITVGTANSPSTATLAVQ